MRGNLKRGVSILALGLMSAPTWAEWTLHEALDRAWERAVQARIAESRASEADASRAVASSWVAKAPSIGVSEKNDRFNDNRGAREREIELALPLWLPGQRAAREALAQSDEADAKAGVSAARLALAGELRAAIWSLAATRADAEIAVERLTTAERLEADVLRRQKAGDLARTDALLAQEETLTAKAAVVEAHTREWQAIGRWRVLTGLDDLPSAIDEAVANSSADTHPRLALTQTALQRARAGMQIAREDRRDPPELSIGVSEERDDFAARSYSSVRVGIRIPLGTRARNAPRLASANSALIRAEAELRRTISEIATEQRNARAAMDGAESQYQAAQSRASLANQRLALQQRAFSLGELGLAELMRVRAAAVEARLELLQARNSLGAARAQLNQAWGVLP